jgi:uncharacterized membrane protein YjjB (DUF3815 family)
VSPRSLSNGTLSRYADLPSDVPLARSSAVGAFVIGLLGCLWSRLGHGTAFTVQSPAILLLVPNGLAAAGGIAMSTSDGQGAFDRGARIALRQIQTAIGITIGLFLANLLVYGFSRKRNGLMTW